MGGGARYLRRSKGYERLDGDDVREVFEVRVIVEKDRVFCREPERGCGPLDVLALGRDDNLVPRRARI